MFKVRKHLITVSVSLVIAIGALVSARAITEWISYTATAEEPAESELQGPAWALAPLVVSANGQYQMSTAW